MAKESKAQAKQDTLIIHLKRFNPRAQSEPYWQTYEIPRNKVSRLLDVLEYIHKELDPSLALRPHYCRDLVCNACYINYNSKPRMACMTPINERMHEITIEPMQGYRVIRDLVVDFLDKTETSR